MQNQAVATTSMMRSWVGRAVTSQSIINIPSITKYIFDIHNFTLESNNFNYYDYLKPECIKNISYVDNSNEIIKIELDRNIIRHCYNRYIHINLNNKQITWYDVSLKGVEYMKFIYNL